MRKTMMIIFLIFLALFAASAIITYVRLYFTPHHLSTFGREYFPEISKFKAPTLSSSKASMPSYSHLEVASSRAGEGKTVSYRLRALIWEAHIEMKVSENELNSAVSKVEKEVDKVGGYIAKLNVGENYAYIVAKIPPDKLRDFLNSIEKIGEVKEKTISATDVTEEYIDLRARLKNAIEEEKRLLKLLNMAKTVEDILKVEQYLNSIREKIERLQAQLSYLENRIDYATVYITIRAYKPKTIEFPSVDVISATMVGLQFLASLAYTLIVLVVALSPLALVALVLYFIAKKTGIIKSKKALSATTS